jgi:Tfp pilus assembly protein PilF
MRALGHPQSAERTKALSDAEVELLEAVRIDPRYGDAYLNLAVTRYHQGAFDAALTYAQRAAQLAPMQGAARAIAGNSLFRLNRFAESIEQIRAAIALGFVDDDTYNFLGAGLLQSGDARGAVDASTRALERTPNNAEIARNLQVARRAMNEMSVPSQ